MFGKMLVYVKHVMQHPFSIGLKICLIYCSIYWFLLLSLVLQIAAKQSGLWEDVLNLNQVYVSMCLMKWSLVLQIAAKQSGLWEDVLNLSQSYVSMCLMKCL